MNKEFAILSSIIVGGVGGELFDNDIPETEPTLFIFSHFC